MLAAAPLRRRTAEEVVAALHAHWVRPFRPPSKLTTDGAREFESRELLEYAGRHGIQTITTSPYNPPANIAESAVKKIKTALRTAMFDASYESRASRLPWPLLLDVVVHNWNITASEATGTAPSALFFGRELRHPSDAIVNRPLLVDGKEQARMPSELVRSSNWLQDRTRDHRSLRAERKATYFDRQLQRLVLPTDTLVTLYRQRSGASGLEHLQRSGPFRVARRMSEARYQLAHMDGTFLERPTHVRWMTPYHLAPDGMREWTRPPADAGAPVAIGGEMMDSLNGGD